MRVEAGVKKASKKTSSTKKGEKKGLTFKRFFTTEGVHPYSQIEWVKKDVAILNDQGKEIFCQKGVEAPSFWSDRAITLVASKYFHGDLKSPKREKSIRQLINRVVKTITQWGKDDGYFKSERDSVIFEEELTYILLHQRAAFNSPVWFNVGVHPKPQCSACFIISVEDSLDSLLELQKTEAKLFKYGSGTGTNLSTIRSTREKLKGGGVPSGPVSFMRAFDAWANVIKSGGKTRRAAKMQILNVDHPDIIEFIRCKQEEEKKAWALIDAGFSSELGKEGGAYSSVAFQNANLSVRVTDEFMKAAEQNKTFWTKSVKDKKPIEELNAAEVLRLIAEGTYVCGDPGMQFHDEINRWHTCPESGEIRASNPCSEYMHLDNSACNLASINLLKYLNPDSTFDIEGFNHTVQVLITAQDILIDNSSYPTKKIEKCARQFRQLGLGYTNLGALLMTLGIPYDSNEGRSLAGAITALMTGEGYRTSAVIAEELSPYEGYRKNKKAQLRVIRQHKDALLELLNQAEASLVKEIAKAAKESWERAEQLGKVNGVRNSQISVLAPTGTISFMMDCDTTGIEPDIALVKYKRLVGGGILKMVNNSVPAALNKLGYQQDQIKEIVKYIEENGTIEGAPYLKEEHLPVFDCAFKAIKGKRFISPEAHLRMMAAAQPFISGAISKTVNLPKDTTVEDIVKTYLLAWKLKLKAVALYRDGSKRTQPLSLDSKKAEALGTPVRRRLPDERQAITHKFTVGGLEGYITVGLYADGKPGEIFIVVAKEGTTLSGIMDAFATAVSISLQYGVPLAALVKKFTNMRFEPAGFTSNKEIPMARSIIDYVFRWLGRKFLTLSEQKTLGLLNGEEERAKEKEIKEEERGEKDAPLAKEANCSNGNIIAVAKGKSLEEFNLSFENLGDNPPCLNCGSLMTVRSGSCHVCLNCGWQGGCG